jgi:hypothetical protein
MLIEQNIGGETGDYRKNSPESTNSIINFYKNQKR